MSRLGMAGRDIADYLRRLGCRLSTTSLEFMLHRLSHVEDAGSGTLSWYRGGEELSDFPGEVLVARSGMHIDGAAKLVAYHDSPRSVLREIITEYGFNRLPPNITKGLDCGIHPSAVLGAEGQSYDQHEGAWVAFPHSGGVRLGGDVDVGPCATIMRGSVGDTVVGDGSKIGNGVNIGHDTRIGRNTLVVAKASIAGWARIGANVRIWQGAIVKNGIRIGDGAQVGMGAVVLTDVPPAEVWVGNPAKKVG